MTNQHLIPFCIYIGITGHRILPDPQTLSTCLDKILTTGYLDAFTPKAREKLATSKSTPIHLTLISPLAEGADRLAAHAALRNGCILEALLPMPREEYKKDFDTLESQCEFNDLLAKAQRVSVVSCSVQPKDPDYRPKAYLAIGTETVNRCDILIALWDGKPSRGMGGTADVVAFALAQQKPVFIVSTEKPGSIELKNGGTLKADFISELERFNTYPLDTHELDEDCAKEFAGIFPSPQADQIPKHLQDIVRQHLLPPYCRANNIATDYQRRYKRTGKLGYLFSTLSVAFMAFAVIFAKHPLFSIPGYVAELCLLISLYFMIHRAEHARVHPGWLENRALAERLRSAFFFAACGEPPAPVSPGHAIHHHNQSWVDKAYHNIVANLPVLTRPEGGTIRGYRQFIDTQWVQGQIDYHNRNAAKLSRHNSQLKNWGMWSFRIAIAVSLVHLAFALSGAVTGHHPEGALLLLEELLSIVAITLPATGAAFGGYRSLLEQSRIAARSRSMAQHLSHIIQQPVSEDPVEFRRYLEQIQGVMLLEAEDWLALMEHAELEKIA